MGSILSKNSNTAPDRTPYCSIFIQFSELFHPQILFFQPFILTADSAMEYASTALYKAKPDKSCRSRNRNRRVRQRYFRSDKDITAKAVSWQAVPTDKFQTHSLLFHRCLFPVFPKFCISGRTTLSPKRSQVSKQE